MAKDKKTGKDFSLFTEDIRPIMFSAWEDKLYPGILFRLLNFGEQTIAEIAFCIGWKHNSVRYEINRILSTKAGTNKHIIKTKYKPNLIKYKMKDEYCNLTLSQYLEMINDPEWSFDKNMRKNKVHKEVNYNAVQNVF